MSTVDRSEGYYHVLRQPIPIESLSVHDIGAAEASISNMKNLFVVVQRNNFQQVIGVFTLQAHTSMGKVGFMIHVLSYCYCFVAQFRYSGPKPSDRSVCTLYD